MKRFLLVSILLLTQLQTAYAEVSLHCADRATLNIRISTTSLGCLENERSLGSGAITTPKVPAKSLHPKVELRFQVARAAAKQEGINLYISSGFRTLERQEYLFKRAIRKHGSYEAAVKWVAPPDVSRHPRGLAMDINYPNDPEGAKWLEIYGYRYGLCRVFENEWWHFEAATAPGETCPATYANSDERG
jgi:LAS superfamily LD-carboxypeptidase LdcB